MCSKPKVTTIKAEEKEVIKDAVQADASIQKASIENRLGKTGNVSHNIRTSNNGIEDEIVSSKKKLLGE